MPRRARCKAADLRPAYFSASLWLMFGGRGADEAAGVFPLLRDGPAPPLFFIQFHFPAMALRVQQKIFEQASNVSPALIRSVRRRSSFSVHCLWCLMGSLLRLQPGEHFRLQQSYTAVNAMYDIVQIARKRKSL